MYRVYEQQPPRQGHAPDRHAALERRRYAAPGVFRLDVDDDLGIAGGEFLLTVTADGAGSAHPLAAGEATPAGSAHLSLSVAALAALYLGGPSAAGTSSRRSQR